MIKQEKIYNHLKKIFCLILIVIHGIFFGYFLVVSHRSSLLTTIEAIALFCLILGTFYAILLGEYFYYFYTGIIISSIVVSFIVPLILIIVIPEIIFLIALTLKGPSSAQIYSRMKVTRDSRLPYYDHSTVRMYNLSAGPPTSGTLGFRMDEVWNPDSTKPIKESENDISLKKKYTKLKITIISLISTVGFLITSIISLIYLL